MSSESSMKTRAELMEDVMAVLELDKETQIELLEAVWDRLEDKRNWTQYAPARNSEGRTVTSNNPSARKWCLSGAIHKEVADLYAGRLYSNRRSPLRTGRGHGGLTAKTFVISNWFLTIAELLEPAIARVLAKRSGAGAWGGTIETFNDRNSWEDVMEALDEALAEARKRES